MTSTSFNVGLSNPKSSSRVLKPPGGGHTDIFGINGNDVVTPSKRKNYPTSTINSCFIQEEVTKPKKETDQIKNNDEPDKNGNNAEILTVIDENTEPKKENGSNEEEKKETVTSKRVRVPPGGFSSGLW